MKNNCKTGTSPLAYLADLINYVLKEINVNGGNLSLAILKQNFHQNFEDLPKSCDSLREEMQIHLCVEVLYSYLKKHPIQGAQLKKDLEEAEENYLEEAYEFLLNKLGTSKKVLEEAQNESLENRIRLANSLGIRERHLNHLLKTPTEEWMAQTFGLPSIHPDVAPPTEDAHYIIWRGYYIKEIGEITEEQAWEEKIVEARTLLQKNVNEVRELLLPDVREKLIAATKKTARQLSEELLINCEYDACLRSSRAQQAITTLQQLIWGIRAGLLKDTHPQWTLEDDNFEEAWQWMGTYESWRSAMMVFLYPENILMPSLKEEMSPKLREIIGEMRKERNFSRERADALIDNYATYFKDLSELSIETTCESAYNDSINTSILFQFGKANGKIYFSTFENGKQDFWIKVPNLDELEVTNLIAATPYKTAVGKRYICLFFQHQLTSVSKNYSPNKNNNAIIQTNLVTLFKHLYMLTFDLETKKWGDKSILIPLPSNPNKKIIVEKRVNESVPPRIYVLESRIGYPSPYGNHSKIFFNDINGDATELMTETWKHLYMNGEKGELYVALSTGNVRMLATLDTNNSAAVRKLEYKEGRGYRLGKSAGGLRDIKTVIFYSKSKFYLIGKSRQLSDNGQNIGSNIIINSAQEPEFKESKKLDFDIDKFINHDGCSIENLSSPSINLKSGARFSFQTVESNQKKIQHGFLYDDSNLLRIHLPIKNLPTAVKYFSLSPNLGENRKDNIASIFRNNEDDFSQHYLWEAYYFLPFYIAQSLQRSRQYQDAKDYYRLIYDFNASSNRKIFYGLVQEENKTSSYGRVNDWYATPLNPHGLAKNRQNAYFHYTLLSLLRCLLQEADVAFTRDTISSLAQARQLYTTVLQILKKEDLVKVEDNVSISKLPIGSYEFDIQHNPTWYLLQFHTENNLQKINACRNIAGEVQLSLISYRYIFLVERAKQLVGIAQQMESVFLAALEKFEAEQLNLLNTHNDLELSNAGIRLQELRFKEAKSGVILAELQRVRSNIQKKHYNTLIKQNLTEYERIALKSLEPKKGLLGIGGFVGGEYDPIPAVLGDLAEIIPFGGGLLSGRKSKHTQRLMTLASFERRKQDWQLQRNLSNQDIRIGKQQERIAKQQVDVVSQEYTIANLRAEQANEVAQYLMNKRLNAELYEWMSEVLQDVYNYFLQNATATAQLAAQQLAFERQASVPAVILSDYWEAPVNNQNSNNNAESPDRMGLTGSARLLQDIYQLDEYALQTDRRKLQLSKTISLASLSPVEFQIFRKTGNLPFYTLLEMFDRDFPGHYLRLIKRVRVSVIALVPPVEGIKATLWSNGISRTVVENLQTFSTTTITRRPESIALTGTPNTSGVFEFEASDQSKLLPFESIGIENAWTFEMSKSANVNLDYDTIADVLLSIDYTALHSATYKEQVLEQLDNTFIADRVFSFRNDFPDQWYDLNHPELPETPMEVFFETLRADFPANLNDLTIKHIVIYFAHENTLPPLTIKLGLNEIQAVGRGVYDGLVSSRHGEHLERWNSILGKNPIGGWSLAIPNNPTGRSWFAEEEIKDILFVITYKGQYNQ